MALRCANVLKRYERLLRDIIWTHSGRAALRRLAVPPPALVWRTALSITDKRAQERLEHILKEESVCVRERERTRENETETGKRSTNIE